LKLKRQWELKIGSGTIDCAIDSTQSIIAAGDVNGKIFICDTDGIKKEELNVDMPIWGIDISIALNLIAVGTASKSPYKGELVLFKEKNILFKKTFNSPVWDVKIIEKHRIVIASTWDDGLFIYNLDSGKMRICDLKGSLFGITHCDDTLYVVASNTGIYKLDLSNEVEPEFIIEEKNICYNACLDKTTKTLYVGSNSNTLLKANIHSIASHKVYSTLSKQICGLATWKENLVTGDLAGNLYIGKIHNFLIPLLYRKFNDSIWNIECIEKNEQLLIACGDGVLYSYKIIEEETSYWNLENLPFDESYLKGVKIFINYAKEDREVVINLYNALLAIGCSPWLDEFNILPGQNWRFETNSAIKGSDFILICLSSASVAKKGYVQKEIKIALDVIDLLPENKIFIIPLKLDECIVPESLGDWQAVDLYSTNGFQKFIYSIYIDRMKNGNIMN
jgi:hypothetical protein